jgi:hypothetical protein
MFICQVTKKVTEPNTSMKRLVVKTRNRVYTRDIRNDETREWETVEVGHGWEIVRELNVSAEGVAIYNAMSPEDQLNFVNSF